MNKLQLNSKYAILSQEKFLNISSLLQFYDWWFLTVKDGKLAVFSQNSEIFQYYWGNELYLHDLSSHQLKTDIQLWSSMDKFSGNYSLGTLLQNWRITEGVSIAHISGNFKLVLCGVTKANIYSFYNSIMGNMFIVNEFIRYLATETENLLINNISSTFELSHLIRK
jgi:hypothetical protein